MQSVASLEATDVELGRQARAAGRRHERRYFKGNTPYVFLLPYFILSAVFFVYPFLSAVTLAFYQTNGPRSAVFVGLDNFRFFARRRGVSHGAEDPAGLYRLQPLPAAAAAAAAGARPRALARSWQERAGAQARGLLSPDAVLAEPGGLDLVGVMFNVMLTPRYGLINRTIHALVGWGLEKHWVEEPALVMPALVISSLWLYVGFNMVYFLAALQTVDKELEQAARIDGAGPLQFISGLSSGAVKG